MKRDPAQPLVALDKVPCGDRVSTTEPAASPENLAHEHAFELREAKLRPPRTSGASVPRRMVERQLADTSVTPIVVVCAGAGYGKTTTLVRWAATAGRPVAWVSLDGHDNDPITLLTYVAEAMARQVHVDPAVFLALGLPGASLETMVIPRLGASLTAITEPLLLILDDVHTITDDACLDALVALALHVPAGAQIVFSTRDASGLPLGVWRTRGLCVEIGPQELRMNGTEARELLDATADGYSDDDVAELVRRTEGWPAGLYLAALSAGAAGVEDAPARLTGNDPLVADFLRSELLAAIPPEQLEFLMRTSMLEPLSGPLCDAVLQRTGSAELLETLERTNRFVVALDRERTSYRCHHLVRDLLAEEFARTAPDELAPLRVRAGDWSLAHGRVVEGIGYAQAADAVDRVAGAVLQWAQPVMQSGRVTTVHRWFSWLWDQGVAARHPALAVLAGLFYATEGYAAECDRWMAVIDELDVNDDPLVEGTRSLLRALRCRTGVEALQRDAAMAVALVSPVHPLHASALLVAGLSAAVTGDTARADDLFVDAGDAVRSVATVSEAPVVLPASIAERALLAVGRGEWVTADTLAQEAVHIARHSRLAESPAHGFAFAVAARTALHAERPERAHEYLTEAQRRLPGFNHVMPVPSVQARLEMARCYLQLADHAGARTMLREIEAIERRTAGLGTLSAEAQELRLRLDAPGGDVQGVTALTAAELRILPLLSTHLSYREIGERRYLSRHTVKSHAMAIYRKLGVSSRSEAVERAREVGLI